MVLEADKKHIYYSYMYFKYSILYNLGTVHIFIRQIILLFYSKFKRLLIDKSGIAFHFLLQQCLYLSFLKTFFQLMGVVYLYRKNVVSSHSYLLQEKRTENDFKKNVYIFFILPNILSYHFI